MADKLDKLMETLSDKSPLLLLGAGFSIGACDNKNRPLLLGKQLANHLFDEVLTKAPIPFDDLKELEKYRDDLKKVCDFIRDEDLVAERNKLLIERMMACKCSNDSFHMKLRGYPWSYIFTLNIDDLVEYIYKDMKMEIQINGNIQQGDTVAPILIKLHGSVNKPDLGFVFDSNEYISFMSKDNWTLTQFGIDYLRKDVIILGTEFQEEDLLLIIEKFQKMSGMPHNLNYFFVTPEIKNRSLKRKIEKNSNMFHIDFTTEQFLGFIEEKITKVNESRGKIRDHGMVFLDEKRSEKINQSVNVANLYLG